MATVLEPVKESTGIMPKQRFEISGLDWQAYRAISEALTGQHVRLTYEKGVLELMTKSDDHGNYAHLLGLFVFVLAEETKLTMRGFGDMTWEREGLERGAEADDCYYLTNAPLVMHKEHIDLETDPPPDLMIEIDVSRSSKRRLRIFAVMRVPEVWKFDGKTLIVLRLGADGQYHPAEHSLYFGDIPIGEIAGFLLKRTEVDEISLISQFRQWVRQQLGR